VPLWPQLSEALNGYLNAGTAGIALHDAPASTLGHGGDSLVRRIYGHLGEIRHRSEAALQPANRRAWYEDPAPCTAKRG
jgi:hypothetical protein